MQVRTALAAFAGAAWLFVGGARAAWAVEHGGEDRATSHAVAIARGMPSGAALGCSGVLVSANVVLTARHCVASVTPAARACDATIGAADVDASDLWVDVAPWTGDGASWKHVRALRVPETGELCGDDVALLALEVPVAPSEAVPARPVVTEAAFFDAVASRGVGLAAFGETATDAHDEGLRRSRFDLAIGCVPGRPGFDCGGVLDVVSLREFTTAAGACRGDSGGGAIAVADHGLVFGILSRSTRGAADADDACAAGIFERTDPWAWLLARTVLDAATPAAPPPTWATALFPATPRAGEFCVADAACGANARCFSFDGRRSFECATTCASDAECDGGTRCEAGLCTRAAPAAATVSRAGCALGGGGSTGGGAWWLVLLALAARRRHS